MNLGLLVACSLNQKYLWFPCLSITYSGADRSLIMGNYHSYITKVSHPVPQRWFPLEYKGHLLGGTPDILSSALVDKNLSFSWCENIETNAADAGKFPALDNMETKIRWRKVHNASESKMGTWLKISFRQYFQYDKHLCFAHALYK